VKYSRQTRAVIWSWATPYAIAAATHSRMIFKFSIIHHSIVRYPKPKPIPSTYVSGFLVYQDLVFCACRIEG